MRAHPTSFLDQRWVLGGRCKKFAHGYVTATNETIETATETAPTPASNVR